MGKFHYEWWTVKAKTVIGVIAIEVKAKNKDGAIRQFEKQKKISDEWFGQYFSGVKPTTRPPTRIFEIYWETLTLDRVGYQREF
jgi:hypothetical protein